MNRSIDLVFQKEVEYDGIIIFWLLLYYSTTFTTGIPLYRFVVPKDAWDWTLPWNRGFCHSESGKKFFDQQSTNCLPSGLLDVSRCQKGNFNSLHEWLHLGEPPIIVSMPNFLYSPEVHSKWENNRKKTHFSLCNNPWTASEGRPSKRWTRLRLTLSPDSAQSCRPIVASLSTYQCGRAPTWPCRTWIWAFSRAFQCHSLHGSEDS